MRAVNVWLAEHVWAQVLLTVALSTTVIMVISPGRSPLEVLLPVATASLGGLGIFLARRRKEQRAARTSTREWASLDDRLRHGEVPQEADERASMRRLVQQRAHTTRHRRLALAFLYVLFLGITVLVGASSGIRQSLAFGLFSLVFLTWATWQSLRQRRVLQEMTRALGAAPDPGPAPH
ncbi:hypothetical protein AMK16_26270 [Streptomyces sp. CB00455]|uniref:hypothetical protein n=1 Tax=Streptomyces sp. CB00455 TaxID=1703927 RepID=UPI00093E0038|nr:hypothetical protein [Streptomyces sp. CB00455]OKK16202.1 hypothetical protein AMK16_26270 [Streptomyces sp. CB00455]